MKHISIEDMKSLSRKGDFAEYYAITWLWDKGWEVFKNIFHIFANSICYLEELLRGTGPWLIHDGEKWVTTDDHTKAVDLLYLHITNNFGILGFKNYSEQRYKAILRVINFFILKLVNNSSA